MSLLLISIVIGMIAGSLVTIPIYKKNLKKRKETTIKDLLIPLFFISIFCSILINILFK